MTLVVNKFTEATSEISDNSKKVGMSAEEYQKWTYAAKQSGLEQSELLSIMKKAQTSFTDARDGVKKSSDAYKRLGIDVKKMTSADAFKAVIKLLAETTDETERNSIANDIFGKSYAELTPLLKEGANGIEKLMQEASDLGGVMSNETVEAGDKFGDTLDKIQTIIGGIAMDIAEALLPYLQQFADWIIDNKDEIIKFAEKTIKSVSDAIAWFIKNKDAIVFALEVILGGFVAFKAVEAVNTAIGIFNTLLLSNPFTAFIIGAGLGVVALITIADHWDDITDSILQAIGAQVKWNALTGAPKGPSEGAAGGGGGGSWGQSSTIAPKIEKQKITLNASGAIFTKPTIFATPMGLQGVGEAGAEAVLPLSRLNGIVSEAVGRVVKDTLGNMVVMLDKEPVGRFVDNRILKAV